VETSELILDKSIQPREETNQETVEQYTELMKQGVVFPKPIVFRRDGKLTVVDGTHRVLAARSAGIAKIEIELRTLTSRQATEHALLANNSHGLSLTQREKRTAVQRMLKDSEWKLWADTKIAHYCGVASKTVGRHRQQLEPKATLSDHTEPAKRIRKFEKNGKTLTMNISHQGRRTKAAEAPRPPTDSSGDAEAVTVSPQSSVASIPVYPAGKVQTAAQASATPLGGISFTAAELLSLTAALNKLIELVEKSEGLAMLIEHVSDPAIKQQALRAAVVLTNLAERLVKAAGHKPSPPATKPKAKARSLWDPLPDSSTQNSHKVSVSNSIVSPAVSSVPTPPSAC
jgi:hypothetical protein